MLTILAFFRKLRQDGITGIKKGCETVDYLKSRKNAYAVLLSGLILGVIIAFLINDDPDTSTLVAAGAIGVVIGEAIMFWRWNKQRKTKQRED